MLWESISNTSCEVCQCNRLLPTRGNGEPLEMNDLKNYNFGDEDSSEMEISLYEIPRSNSSRSSSPSPSKSPGRFICRRRHSGRIPLEDCDLNSQDSGYGNSFQDKTIDECQTFKFVEPSNTAPRSVSDSCRLKGSPVLFRHRNSDNTSATEDDVGLLDLLEFGSMDDDITSSEIPINLGGLISGTIANSSSNRTTPRNKQESRSNCNYYISEQNTCRQMTPVSSRARSSLFKSESPHCPRPALSRHSECFETNMMLSPISVTVSSPTTSTNQSESPALGKRPKPSFENKSPIMSKRHKFVGATSDENLVNSLEYVAVRRLHRSISAQPLEYRSPTMLQRSISANEESIMSAVQRSSEADNLIGDFSKCFVLPLVRGQHQDMKYISSNTLARLIKGDFNDRIASYKVIDCRYPYEYEGGHIAGALNYYSKEMIVKELIDAKRGVSPVSSPNSSECRDINKRDIIIFHCEFSSQRGPRLSRCLREIDRSCNNEVYPALHYPEVYLLHGGYKEFYESHAELCVPNAYLPMNDPAHNLQFRQFRAQSRSWSENRKNKFQVKHSFM